MLNSRYLLSAAQRAQSKNSNLSHHQQRGIVTNLPSAFYGICPKLYSWILFLKSNLIFSWWSAQLFRPTGHFPWISQTEWKIQNWLDGGQNLHWIMPRRVEGASEMISQQTNNSWDTGLCCPAHTPASVRGLNIPLLSFIESLSSWTSCLYWQLLLTRRGRKSGGRLTQTGAEARQVGTHYSESQLQTRHCHKFLSQRCNIIRTLLRP